LKRLAPKFHSPPFVWPLLLLLLLLPKLLFPLFLMTTAMGGNGNGDGDFSSRHLATLAEVHTHRHAGLAGPTGCTNTHAHAQPHTRTRTHMLRGPGDVGVRNRRTWPKMPLPPPSTFGHLHLQQDGVSSASPSSFVLFSASKTEQNSRAQHRGAQCACVCFLHICILRISLRIRCCFSLFEPCFRHPSLSFFFFFGRRGALGVGEGAVLSFHLPGPKSFAFYFSSARKPATGNVG